MIVKGKCPVCKGALYLEERTGCILKNPTTKCLMCGREWDEDYKLALSVLPFANERDLHKSERLIMDEEVSYGQPRDWNDPWREGLGFVMEDLDYEDDDPWHDQEGDLSDLREEE